METRVHIEIDNLFELDKKNVASSCWMGRASSFWALRKACCRSLLLIGCRFKCFWGSPTAPLGQGPCLDNVTVGPLFKNFTLYRHHTLCFIFTSFFTSYVMLSVVHILLACTLCNIKRKVLFYNMLLWIQLYCWGLKGWLVMHLMFTWLHCMFIVYTVQPPSCTGAMFWRSIACNKYWILQGILL